MLAERKWTFTRVFNRRGIPLRFLLGTAYLSLLMGAALCWHRWGGGITAEGIQHFLNVHSTLAPLLFIAAFALSIMLLLPVGLPMNLGAGLLWGAWAGGLYTTLGAALAAALSFWIARYLAFRPLARLAARKHMAWALHQIATHDWQLIVLTRINPIMPFGIMNYLFGLTGISFRRYITATVASNMVLSFLFAAVGATISDVLLTQNLKSGIWNTGLALLAATVFYLGKLFLRARADLQQPEFDQITTENHQ